MEASGSMSELWLRWQGQVINGVGRLGGCLGYADHSGVFLTESAARRPSVVAVKLIPTNRALTETLLPRWKRAASLAHPRLISIWDFGGCQLDSLPHLYAVMEYAEQTLAQVLLRRSLTTTEAIEMLLPTLEALAFLHGQNLVQGQLKPANILVVGDQLKLASDTIRRVRDGPPRAHNLTIYDPPEVRQGSSPAAGDIWALGITLFEALTRRQPSVLGEPGEALALPGDFPAAFEDVVTRCLSLSPQARPSVTELIAWARGHASHEAPVPTIPPAAPAQLGPGTLKPADRAAPLRVTPDAPNSGPTNSQSGEKRPLLTASVAAVVILALAWTGVNVFRKAHISAAPQATSPTAAPPSVPVPAETFAPTPKAAAPTAVEVTGGPSARSNPMPDHGKVATSPSVLHEDIPEVPLSARQTIHGHIKVWVRVIVDQDGSVLETVADRTGPSRYFLRLAIEAAKKWQFPPAESPSRRLMQVRFDFSRGGTTGHAVTLQ